MPFAARQRNPARQEEIHKTRGLPPFLTARSLRPPSRSRLRLGFTMHETGLSQKGQPRIA